MSSCQGSQAGREVAPTRCASPLGWDSSRVTLEAARRVIVAHVWDARIPQMTAPRPLGDAAGGSHAQEASPMAESIPVRAHAGMIGLVAVDPNQHEAAE